MIVPGPTMEACRSCWLPPGECDHDDGFHRWEATAGWFCVAHPALSQAITGRFSYPVDDGLVVRWIARHRRALRKVFAVDPKAHAMVYWIEPDPDPNLEALGLGPTAPTARLLAE